MWTVISNLISSWLPWCLTCMSLNGWSYQSERKSNLNDEAVETEEISQVKNSGCPDGKSLCKIKSRVLNAGVKFFSDKCYT